jgi:hypothetical protein
MSRQQLPSTAVEEVLRQSPIEALAELNRAAARLRPQKPAAAGLLAEQIAEQAAAALDALLRLRDLLESS